MSVAIVSFHHDTPMTTSLAIAEGVQMAHEPVIKLIRKHVDHLYKFGTFGFEIQKSGGRHTEFAWLNEQQATLLLTFMRNSEIVIEFKIALVRAFFDLRDRVRAEAVPYRGDPLSMTHRADIAVAADRTFRSWMRSGRSAGLSTSHALRRANEQTRLATGIDMLAELDVSTDMETEPVLSADRFLKCWRDAQLDAPFACCAFADLYQFYRRWCDMQAEPWPISKNKFSQAVNATPGMRTARKAVLKADGRRGGVINCVMLVSDPVPQSESIQSWMMIRLSAFRDAVGGAL